MDMGNQILIALLHETCIKGNFFRTQRRHIHHALNDTLRFLIVYSTVFNILLSCNSFNKQQSKQTHDNE